MLCPVCKIDRLTKAEDGFLNCPKCGLHRRAVDKILMCKETNFHVLNRNVQRSPEGTEVEVVETNPGLRGIYGQLKAAGPTYALRSLPGFIIALSRDKDDLILLVVECGWRIRDPELAALVDGIRYDNTTRNVS